MVSWANSNCLPQKVNPVVNAIVLQVLDYDFTMDYFGQGVYLRAQFTHEIIQLSLKKNLFI